MADKKISLLDLAGALDGSELTVVVQNGTTKNVPISTLIRLCCEPLAIAVTGNRLITASEILHLTLVLQGAPATVPTLTLPDVSFRVEIINEMGIDAIIQVESIATQETLQSASAKNYYHLA